MESNAVDPVDFREAQHKHCDAAGEAQEEAWDAITQAAAEAGGSSGPLRLSNVVLLASGTA